MARAVLIDRPSEHVVRLTLNEPAKLNALSCDLLGALAAELALLAEDDDVRCVILTGAGRAFAAGADLSDMLERGAESYRDPKRLTAWRAIDHFEKPIVAAVNGYALGGGCELMMLCDIIVAAAGAKIGQPEAKVGAFPGDGGTQRLPRIVGRPNAMKLILTGDIISAEEAKAINLVSDVVPDADLQKHAEGLAATIASRPPLALRAAKRLVRMAFERPMSEGLRAEHDATIEIFATNDRLEGQRAFLEKRRPNFQGN